MCHESIIKTWRRVYIKEALRLNQRFLNTRHLNIMLGSARL